MKFRMIYTFFALFMGSYLFYSASGGAGLVQMADRTGSPVAQGFCGTCHSANAFNSSLTITVLDGMNTVTSYEPGVTYTVQVNISDDGNASVYGFQAVALDAADNSSGDFGAAPAGLQTVMVAGRDYIEHNSPSNSGSFEFNWTAPAAATGDVTLYASGNAANGNGSTGGDGASTGSLTLTETVSSLFEVKTLPVSLDIFPNPVQDILNLSIESDIRGTFDLNVFNLKGQLLQQEVVQLSVTNSYQQVNVDNLPKGNYILQLTDEDKMITKKMIKL